MSDLKSYIRDVPDFPKRGILFRDIAPLLKERFAETIAALSALLDAHEWSQVDAIAGIESRGFILAAALAVRHGKGFVLVRKKGKLPPPVVALAYALEYGEGVLEMQPGRGRLLMVDDVLATGGTLVASAALAERAGYTVSESLVLMDLKLQPAFTWGPAAGPGRPALLIRTVPVCGIRDDNSLPAAQLSLRNIPLTTL